MILEARKIFLTAACCAVISTSFAEETAVPPPVNDAPAPAPVVMREEKPVSKVFFDTKLIFGVGSKGIKVARTTEGDDVEISAGGGLGGLVSVGLRANDKADALLSAGMQFSSLVPRLNNASATFKRKFLLLTGRYKFRFGSGAFRPGVGVGVYQGGRLRLNLAQLGGSDYEMSYDDAVGLHAGFDFEAPFGRQAAFCLGVKYTAVSYDIKSLTVDGQTQPASILVDDFRRFRGDAVDFSVGLKF